MIKIIGAILATALVAVYLPLEREAEAQHADVQQSLRAGCQMVWDNIEKVRAMPEYKGIAPWCREI